MHPSPSHNTPNEGVLQPLVSRREPQKHRMVARLYPARAVTGPGRPTKQIVPAPLALQLHRHVHATVFSIARIPLACSARKMRPMRWLDVIMPRSAFSANLVCTNFSPAIPASSTCMRAAGAAVLWLGSATNAHYVIRHAAMQRCPTAAKSCMYSTGG